MELDFGTLKFENEKQYYYALGVFCNSDAFRISYENNKATGSFSDAYRMRMLATAKFTCPPITAALRSNDRINCNRYVENLMKTHFFVQSGRAITGVLENVLRSVPKKYMSTFLDGYTNSAARTGAAIAVYETEAIAHTATSLKRAAVPKRGGKTPARSPKTAKTKHDHIRQSIRNADVGQRGEKLVFDAEREKLKAAKEAGKTVPDIYPQWTALDNDSAGYDIMSYDVATEQPMYIEVKTTTEGKLTPFFMSAGEVAFSKRNAAQYHLYRVYNLKNTVAEYFELAGDISSLPEIQLDAENYHVSVR